MLCGSDFLVKFREQAITLPYGRIIVLLWFGLWIYVPGAASIFEALKFEQNWHSWSVFYFYYADFIMAMAIILILTANKITWTEIIGKDLSPTEFPSAIQLTIFLFFFSIAAAYALFIPLSYVVPGFVQWWYIDIPPVIFYELGTFPVLANVLSFFSLVVIAPIIEEVLFRGLLLRRWAKKWNLVKAIALSSIIFGALHSDPIGACAFGIGMCILYLRTQSLYVPIICHAANNFVAWLIEAGYIYWYGPEYWYGHEYQYTIVTLRSEWYIGLICGLIVVVWTVIFLKAPLRPREWKLPAT